MNGMKKHWGLSNYLLVAILATFLSCDGEKEDTLFRLLDSTETGLSFSNDILISDSLNAVIFEYIYNGGGAAVCDVNNDGIKDLFFAGNMVSSKLYLGNGDLTYKDVTEAAGVITDRWCTGVSIVDINNDGLQDIYISVAGMVDPDQRRNIFFINQIDR